MSISRRMDEKAVEHIHNGILLSHVKEYTWLSSNEVDEPPSHQAALAPWALCLVLLCMFPSVWYKFHHRAITQHMFCWENKWIIQHHSFHHAQKELFFGTISFLAPLDINDADDKEIPEADQLRTNHSRAKTRSYMEEFIIFLIHPHCKRWW